MTAVLVAVLVTGLSTHGVGPRPVVGAPPGDTVTVRLTNELRYVPDRITVKSGTTVVWKNASVLVHSVTDDPAKATVDGSSALPSGAKPFDSGLLDPEHTFRHTFTVKGTYRYFCIPHEGAHMWGTLIVQ